MNTKEYEFHPYASVLPMLGVTEAGELAADIQEYGLREPIILFEGKILDGRNRFKACKIAGVEPRFEDFNGNGDPIAFIVSKNIRRRHLTAAQKGMAVSKFDSMPRGDISRIQKSAKTPTVSQSAPGAHRENSTPEDGPRSAKELAKQAGISTRTVVDSRKVRREGSPELVAEVERGEKSLKTAVKEIKAGKEEKEKHFDKTGYPIPDSILADWQAAESFKSTLNTLQQIRLDLEKALARSDLPFRQIGQDTVIDLKNAWAALKQVLPYAVCPSCQGRTRSKCTVCKQMGFVGEFGYRHWFAKEVIDLREKAIKK